MNFAQINLGSLTFSPLFSPSRVVSLLQRTSKAKKSSTNPLVTRPCLSFHAWFLSNFPPHYGSLKINVFIKRAKMGLLCWIQPTKKHNSTQRKWQNRLMCRLEREGKKKKKKFWYFWWDKDKILFWYERATYKSFQGNETSENKGNTSSWFLLVIAKKCLAFWQLDNKDKRCKLFAV